MDSDVTKPCRRCNGPKPTWRRYYCPPCAKEARKASWRRKSLKWYRGLSPEEKRAYLDRAKRRKRTWTAQNKISRAAREEARERGVDPSVIRAEWRVT